MYIILGIAALMVISTAFSKTSQIRKIQQAVSKWQDRKSGMRTLGIWARR
jgi:hypothetical protein